MASTIAATITAATAGSAHSSRRGWAAYHSDPLTVTGRPSTRSGIDQPATLRPGPDTNGTGRKRFSCHANECPPDTRIQRAARICCWVTRPALSAVGDPELTNTPPGPIRMNGSWITPSTVTTCGGAASMRSFRSPSSTVAVTPGTGGRIPSTRASKLVEMRPELTWASADAGLIAAAAAHAASATDSRTSTTRPARR